MSSAAETSRSLCCSIIDYYHTRDVSATLDMTFFINQKYA
ncbi:hypothetical protein SAMN04515668_3608 [Hymenobacter arizonensis]|uniref:Uncharacterized protein n=1 Tax=Hymenobacter arizonensis TaxID=1227077 RepID=A0A1I6AF22_HYMAR|nr:hypothetical protein SAMN04515668_3608 [Hymenobacter arizonensis]